MIFPRLREVESGGGDTGGLQIRRRYGFVMMNAS